MIGIVLQARTGSSRLPGKVLKRVSNNTLLEHIIERIQNASIPYPLVVATSLLQRDDVIETMVRSRDIHCFRGSESNVLKRYYQCALHYGFQHVVRLTADNPLTDIPELLNLIEHHISGNFDYTHSFSEMPLGVGAEIFTFNALKRSFCSATKAHQIEHVNEYIYDHASEFRIGFLSVHESKHSANLRLTIDTRSDLERIRRLFTSSANSSTLTTQEAIRICSLFR